MKKDCPLYKKKKKALHATWDEDESPFDEDKQNEYANMCFFVQEA